MIFRLGPGKLIASTCVEVCAVIHTGFVKHGNNQNTFSYAVSIFLKSSHLHCLPNSNDSGPAACRYALPLQSGDMLILDNHAIMHGCLPFQGEDRQIVTVLTSD